MRDSAAMVVVVPLVIPFFSCAFSGFVFALTEVSPPFSLFLLMVYMNVLKSKRRMPFSSAMWGRRFLCIFSFIELTQMGDC